MITFFITFLKVIVFASCMSVGCFIVVFGLYVVTKAVTRAVVNELKKYR